MNNNKLKRFFGERMSVLLFSDFNYLFIISILLTILLRLCFIKVPFFILDEAQLMTFGEQLFKGGVYALDVVDTRGPGGYYIIGFFNQIFGYGNITAFRLFALCLQLIIIIEVRSLGGLLFNHKVANISSLFYSIFSYSYILHDTMALNVEILSLFFLLVSAILFYKEIAINLHEKEALFKHNLVFILCGILCAIIFSIKQVIAAALLSYLYMLYYNWRNNNFTLVKSIKIAGLLFFGFNIGIITILSYSVIKAGFVNNFYWLALFSLRHYNPGIIVKITRFGQRVLLLYIAQPLLWTLAIIWIAMYLKPTSNTEDKKVQNRIFLFFMLVMQLVGTIIAGQVVGHYFIPSIAFMSIMAGDLIVFTIEQLKNTSIVFSLYKRHVLVFIMLIGLFPPLINYTLFPEGVQTPEFAIGSFFREKVVNKNNPINNAALFIKQNTNKNDKIFILGNLYELYVLSNRVPSTVALILGWFKDRDNDICLNKTYKLIVTSLRDHSPKIIVLPSNDYRGIDLDAPSWKDIKQIIHEKYGKPIRIEWKSRLLFYWGKYKLADKTDEWLDIYMLKKQ